MSGWKRAAANLAAWKRAGASLAALVAIALLACGVATAAAGDLAELQGGSDGSPAALCQRPPPAGWLSKRCSGITAPGRPRIMVPSRSSTAWLRLPLSSPESRTRCASPAPSPSCTASSSRARCSRPSSTAWRRRAASPRFCATSSPPWTTTPRSSPSVWRGLCSLSGSSETRLRASSGVRVAEIKHSFDEWWETARLNTTGLRSMNPAGRSLPLAAPSDIGRLCRYVAPGREPGPRTAWGPRKRGGSRAQQSTAVWTGSEMIVWGG